VRRLLPDPASVDPVEIYGDLPAAEGRPAVRLNMVASADGATAVDGRSGALGGAADRRLFLLLRTLADVVLVGAGTVRAEGYGPPRSPGPAIAVVTRSLDLDWDSRLFGAGEVRPIVVTVADAPAERRAQAERQADVIVAGEGDVDLRRALDALAGRGARHVLCEGGPTLNGDLAADGLVDELCLTISPALASGETKRILAGPALPALVHLELRSACEEDGFLFLRYRPRA
jgi:riboflavin biosynthesis pyrimidine reductase